MFIIILGIVATFGVVGATEQEPVRSAAEVLRQLRSDVPRWLDSAGVTGFGMAMLEGRRIRWATGFGVRSSATAVAVDGNTVFEAASLSKPVFAYAVLRLSETGVLELDRPLCAYLSAPEVCRTSEGERITARMILSHTSGLVSEGSPGGPSLNELLRPTFEPGTRFRYSGDAFFLLQQVVMHQTGEPFAVLMDRLVLRPLGMSRSSFVLKESMRINAAAGHERAGAPAQDLVAPIEGGWACCSLLTTARDYARFLRAILRRQGLKDHSVRQILTPKIEIAPAIYWGVGFGIQHGAGGSALWQWGHSSRPYRAYTLLYPQRGTGIVLLANSRNAMPLLHRIVRAIFGNPQPAIDWLHYK